MRVALSCLLSAAVGAGGCFLLVYFLALAPRAREHEALREALEARRAALLQDANYWREYERGFMAGSRGLVAPDSVPRSPNELAASYQQHAERLP